MYDLRAPLYLTPPSSEAIKLQMGDGNLGFITTPRQGNVLPPGVWWAADNGCFGDRYIGDDAYLDYLAGLSHLADRCLFAVAPDVVADYEATVQRAYDMLPRIRALGYPVAFVAQDGFENCAWDLWDSIDCLFIGGSDDWKLSSEAASLARLARSLWKWVHVGRVNSFKRYRWAALVAEAHSVDGTHLTNGPDELLPDVLDWRQQLIAQPDLDLFA
ncbi:hypothetical protein [Nonomuraea sp. SYSU D8015]|uniref:hypothetical protein n=1 Tax=Nonomuraea sp. SYSU D8015 TaxID=2593644 RepID=UPI001CB74DCB|nr:hypothetical protein [Nonomuraea sp. SYSU D8015]